MRLVSPFINTWSLVFLVGGAAVSARKFKLDARFKGRFIGNVLIAVGGLLPGIGGSLTRAGYVEGLYITELMGLILIYLGYRSCLAAPRGGGGSAARGGRGVGGSQEPGACFGPLSTDWGLAMT